MAEWYICFDGCECSDCRERRSDWLYMRDVMRQLGDYQEATDLEDNRLDNAMKNLGYSRNLQSSTKKSYRK